MWGMNTKQAINLLAVVVVILWLIPVIWVAINSIKPTNAINPINLVTVNPYITPIIFKDIRAKTKLCQLHIEGRCVHGNGCYY